MTAEWNTLVARLDIYQEGRPTSTTVALTSRQEMERSGIWPRQHGTPAVPADGRCRPNLPTTRARQPQGGNWYSIDTLPSRAKPTHGSRAMARSDTQYHNLTDSDELTEELQELDWSREHTPPVEEAAALIYEIWQEQDDDAENNLHELLDEVPYQHRQQVMYLIMEHNMASDDAGDSTAASDLHSAQHPDLERTQHTMRYVEEICGADAALSLQQVMQESRQLALREQLSGSPENYTRGDPHTLYVQCIADLQAAVAAKQAMNGQPWNEQELSEAVQHEVNRMSYRLALEVQDRLIQQLNDCNNIQRYAKENGTAPADVNEFGKLAKTLAKYAFGYQQKEAPTYDNIKIVSICCTTKLGIEEALRQNDQEAVRQMAEMLRNNKNSELYHLTRQFVDEDALTAIDDARDSAQKWNKAAIEDGAVEYHLTYVDLSYIESNAAREAWLTGRHDAAERETEARDCVTRAFNEATGGADYGYIWEKVTETVQANDASKDADQGVDPQQCRELYESLGFREILVRQESLNDLMRRHLDIREIPTLLSRIFDDDEASKAVNFIACSTRHAVAVVDGAVHDSWDSRQMGDRINEDDTINVRDHRLVQLLIPTDDEATLLRAKEVIEAYAAVRRYDDVLTYGRKRREKPDKD